MGEGPCEEELQRTLEFDRASEHLEKGQYESSLLLLEKLGQQYAGYKDVAELVAVAEVWLAATRRSCSCTTLNQSKNLDWYLILKVEAHDGMDVIRRRYHQLALLLHPDKNKHQKAEGAFKLVSEAYRCLADSKKRALFDAYRSKTTCEICFQKSCDLNDSCTSSVLGKDEPQQKHSKYCKSSSDKNDHTTEKESDDEKLQMFRERARARVESMAQGWKEKRSRLNEELEVVDIKIQCNNAGKKQMTTFETYKCQSPCYFEKKVQSDKQGNIGVPSCSNINGGLTKVVHATNISTCEKKNHCKEAKPEMSDYRKPTSNFAWSNGSKHIPSASMKNFAPKDLKEVLTKQQACVRESTETPKNLKGLLQKLRGDSKNGTQYHGSKILRRTAIHDNRSFPVYKYSEAPRSDNEENPSLYWYNNILKIDSLPYSGENEYRGIQRKQLAIESELNLPSSNSYNPQRLSKKSEDAENARNSEELVKTTEHLKVRAKCVAAILKRWKQGIVG